MRIVQVGLGQKYTQRTVHENNELHSLKIKHSVCVPITACFEQKNLIKNESKPLTLKLIFKGHHYLLFSFQQVWLLLSPGDIMNEYF